MAFDIFGCVSDEPSETLTLSDSFTSGHYDFHAPPVEHRTHGDSGYKTNHLTLVDELSALIPRVGIHSWNKSSVGRTHDEVGIDG